jgi:hypothetical protein
MLRGVELSECSSSSERSCLRLPVVGSGSVAVCVGAAGCPEELLEGLGFGGGAENAGEREVWEVGMAGSAAVTGDGGFGGISSARTNAGAGYPQRSGYMSKRTALARIWLGPGLRWTHQ